MAGTNRWDISMEGVAEMEKLRTNMANYQETMAHCIQVLRNAFEANREDLGEFEDLIDSIVQSLEANISQSEESIGLLGARIEMLEQQIIAFISQNRDDADDAAVISKELQMR